MTWAGIGMTFAILFGVVLLIKLLQTIQRHLNAGQGRDP